MQITLQGRVRLENYKTTPRVRLLVKTLNFVGLGNIATLATKRFGVLAWDTGFVNNLATSVGKAAAAGLVGNTGGIAAFTFLAVGTSATAPAIGDTTLTAEITTGGLGRVAATVSRITTTVTNDTLQLTNTFTSSGSFTVNEVGMFNAISAGIILGHALTGAKTVASGDLLVATYQMQFA